MLAWDGSDPIDLKCECFAGDTLQNNNQTGVLLYDSSLATNRIRTEIEHHLKSSNYTLASSVNCY
ncbi:hypothetical protein [Brevibacillus halotolerans]|uniref:hypothetical protein n=1 Tax=Brevibacillus halotolerans TaxID=1507437 RepID=UPI0015EF8433|nr:hypothetical protein [Brevibacillus halotolerans]MBA4535114.1 hypothetical protein [Brevibacillus halotolerans]